MIASYLLILLKSMIPIGLISFCLVWWAQRRDYLGGASSLKEYERWIKTENQARKAEKKRYKAEKKRLKQERQEGLSQRTRPNENTQGPGPRKFDPLHNKWMAFGGGFYGVVALFTYAVIEAIEVRDFLIKLPNVFEHGLVNLLVNLFIESAKNFITAIIWPAYWLRRLSGEPWLWLIGAYAGYWLGTHAAFRFSSRRVEDSEP